MQRIEVAIVQITLLVDARAKFVAINMEYGNVKVQKSRNYAIVVLVAIIMELFALEVKYVEQKAVVTLTIDYCTKIEVNLTRTASHRNWQQFIRMLDQLVWIKLNRNFQRQ